VSLRHAAPIAFHPRGISDTLDGSTAFNGAMAALANLIPDPSTRNLWQCRPAATLVTNFVVTGGPFSPGFSSGFLVSSFPTPLGAVSCALIVGDVLYGMVDAGGVGLDYPFAYNLRTNLIVPVSGITGGNRPATQPSAGAWTPPIMDVVGTQVLVAHPGFNGTGGVWFGWFDISNPAAVTWNGGDLGGAGGVTFASLATPPTSVANFNQRAYWMVNPKSGTTPPATIFSDVLAPRTVTNANQILTYDDATPLSALGKLPLSNQLGGIIQALIVFKGVSNMYQVTGDAALSNLARNALNVATGTFAPLSIAPTPKGLAFIAPDGLRFVDFSANVSDPIGTDGMGKTLPFLYAITPSRISAAANGTVYRVSVDDGSRIGSAPVEYWFDFSRGGIWSGPHTFPASIIKPYQNTFIVAPRGVAGSLWRSDYLQSATSTFVENTAPLSFNYQTAMLPDTDQMSENSMIETTIYLGMAAGGTYLVQALDQNQSVLQSASVSNPASPVIWGSFTWGQALWGGASSALFPQRIPWPKPVVFRRMSLNVTGPSSQQLRVGTLHMRYEKLGYLQQGAAA